MTKSKSQPETAVAAFIHECTAQLERQAAHYQGWPNPLRLPVPRNDAERHALKLWLQELQQQTGATIRVEHPT